MSKKEELKVKGRKRRLSISDSEMITRETEEKEGAKSDEGIYYT